MIDSKRKRESLLFRSARPGRVFCVRVSCAGELGWEGEGGGQGGALGAHLIQCPLRIDKS